MSDTESSVLKYFLSGGFGGVCTVIIGHPFDTIKVRLQTMPVSVSGEKPLYEGTWDCAAKIVRKEGFSGLYKGMGAPIAGVGPVFALSFFGFGLGKKLLQLQPDNKINKFRLFCSGAFSGLFTTIIMTPGERVKCLLQVQQQSTGLKTYSGPKDVIKQLYKEGGIRSLYKGTVATLLRDVPASGMYFMSYEWIQELLKQDDSSDDFSLFDTIIAGGIAGMCNWFIGMPADVLKSRLQTAPEGMYPRGIRDVFRQMMVEEGPTGLYKGCVPVMIRAFPANAACFTGFELAMRFLNWLALSY